jgi:hypothetical protein
VLSVEVSLVRSSFRAVSRRDDRDVGTWWEGWVDPVAAADESDEYRERDEEADDDEEVDDDVADEGVEAVSEESVLAEEDVPVSALVLAWSRRVRVRVWGWVWTVEDDRPDSSKSAKASPAEASVWVASVEAETALAACGLAEETDDTLMACFPEAGENLL